MKKTLLLIAAAVTFSGLTIAQKNDAPKWDVNYPPGKFKSVNFDVSEGTWMNLDVSPDGKELVFDMLGDIYTMPVTGGKAKAIRTGYAFEVQPRYSPDGKRICFTSDAGGGDNIWVMDRDGNNAKQITKEDFRLLNNGIWHPSGNYLIARKHFTSGRSLGAGELWMYHISGGDGIQLTKRKNEQQDLGEPTISPDGKLVYYSEDMYPGGYFQYNKDPNSQIYVIKSYDTEKGEIETVTGGNGGAFRPQISRNGKLLAFGRRVREQTVLYIRDLATGAEWPVYDKLSKDQQEAWAIFGVYTNFNWMPDDKEIIIWANGKLNRIDIATGKSTDIPFTVSNSHRITEAIRFTRDAAPDSFPAKAIRHAITSPDNKTLVFNAAGYLYAKALPDGKPYRLTTSTDFEFEPAFSKDGKSVVYVSWNDETMGAILTASVGKAGSKPVKLSTDKGIFRTPSWSPDGKQIIYVKEEGNDHQGFLHSVKPGIYVMSSTGGTPRFIRKSGSSPMFTASNDAFYFFEDEGDSKSLKSVKLDESELRTHFTSKYATSIVPSPDAKWVAFTELFKVYIASFPPSGKPMDLASGAKAFPVSQAAKDGGLSLHWSSDSKALHWTAGDEYFTRKITDGFTFVEGARDTVLPADSTGLKIGLMLASDKPKGLIALRGARIITMDASRTVIEDGMVLIDGNRITAVGKAAEMKISSDTKIIDVTGKTIMPGLIDVHAHLGTFRHGLSPQKQWSYYANLAYGVTTTHDPSSNSEMVFSQSEMVKSGTMRGPRIFSTGWILYGAEGDFKTVINKPEDAWSAIKRTSAFGAFSVKSYNQPRRDQRQMVIDAARSQKINVVPEGGSFFFHNLSMILDGHTGIEHNLPIGTLYEDVLNLWSQSKTGYTPTLIVGYGGVTGEYYFYQKYNVWENQKLLKYTPRFVIDPRSRHRTMIPDAEYNNGHLLVSRSCKALADRGVKVNLGAHGQIQGIGAHWELWMLQQGGMTNMQALECATVNGAHYIGMEKDLGSLESGKLADLIVLDANPLDDIQNSEKVRYTMVNGRLYDTETMNEIGNYNNPRGKFYFENVNSQTSVPHMGTHGHGHGDED